MRGFEARAWKSVRQDKKRRRCATRTAVFHCRFMLNGCIA
jgi:hypothetical protein